MNVLVSACLLGVNCRYDGTGAKDTKIDNLKKKYTLIPICPEIYGGLNTPREPAEIQGGKVITRTGRDVTDFYKKGAEEILKLAEFYDCKYAILKERSPSCGFGEVYDGSFSGSLKAGNGIAAELLAQNGITVLGESCIDELL